MVSDLQCNTVLITEEMGFLLCGVRAFGLVMTFSCRLFNDTNGELTRERVLLVM